MEKREDKSVREAVKGMNESKCVRERVMGEGEGEWWWWWGLRKGLHKRLERT